MTTENQTTAATGGFGPLGIDGKLLESAARAGFVEPKPIQVAAIPAQIAGKDILGVAQTGSGKTAAFALPILKHIAALGDKRKAKTCRALILAPTRELAVQIEETIRAISKGLHISTSLVLGGVSRGGQVKRMAQGVDILVATPGRLTDLVRQNEIVLSETRWLVLDEADRMLDMGFIPDIERIAKLIPFTRQTLFFSATMQPEIQKLADRFLQNPQRIEVAPPSSTAKTVTQRLVASHSKDYEKRAVLRDIIKAQDDLKNAIIFCNRKKDVADLFRSLDRHGFSVGALHGDMDQRSRTTMLANFKDNNITLLVASDVAARGLDIPDVSHVFNFDVPIHAEDYVHRIGRTGRAGRSGKAFTLVTRSDTKYLDAIEKLIGEKIEWLNGDLSELPAPMESHDSDRARKGGRGRDKDRDRDRDRDRGRGKRSETAPKAEQPEEVETVEEVAVEASQEQNRPERRSERRPQPAARAGRQNPANDDSRDRRSRHRRDQDDGPTPVGFGDDIPAFMLIVANAGKA